jgi:heme/copper-type cytochrome/quinol oxidase subunit 2
LGKGGSTILALVATYYVAMATLPLIAIIGIALATLFRFIFFFVDLVIFIWSIPFSITAIFLSQAEEAIRKFVEEVIKFALLILLITIAPVLGIVVMEITKFVIYQYMGVAITKIGEYTNSVGEFILLLLSSLIYVATQIGVIIYAFRITFKSPDFILEKVKLSASIAGSVAEEAYQSIASKIAPKI